MTDSQYLLAEYRQNGSDAAFRELVERFVDLVYSTALRLVAGDTHRAEDVTQTVFLNLARKARSLPEDVKLGGWLHRNTYFVATTLTRGEHRRQSRERQAMEMNALQNHSEADFSQVAPMLDEAINELGEADRTAILLRFFEQQDFRAVGQALGSNEDAARMRVTRALEKLEGFLKRRGVTTSAASLGVVLMANAVQASPVGLAVTISTTAALVGTTIAATATATATKAIVMTSLQKTLIAATLAAAIGTGIYEARQASSLREKVQTLQQQQEPLTEQVQQLHRERDEAKERLAVITDEIEKAKSNASELVKSRDLVATHGSVKPSKSMANSNSPAEPAVSVGVDLDTRMRDLALEAKLSRLRDKLALTIEQETALRKLLHGQMTKADELLKRFQESPPDSLILAEVVQSSEKSEEEIKSRLTPEQQAAYGQLKQQEWTASARASANGELITLQNVIGLTQEQQDLVFPILYQEVLKEKMRMEGGFSLISDGQGLIPQSVSESLQQSSEQRMKGLGTILTPAQLEKYREILAVRRTRSLSAFPSGR